MRGDHNVLTLTTTYDEATGEEKPLFSFPVQVCKAHGSVDVKLDRATPDGGEYDTVYRDKVTEKVYEYGDLIRGVRQGDGFKPIADDQLEAIDEATKLPDMRVEQSTPLADVPFERAQGFYYLQSPPKGGAHKAYRLLFEALRAAPKKGQRKAQPARALRVKFTSRKRQKLGAVYADEGRGCLTLVTLTFAADMREPDEGVLAPQGVEVEQKQVDTARKVVAQLENPVDPQTGKPREDVGDWNTPADDAIEAKRELVEKAAAGETIEAGAVEPVAETAESDALGAILEASVKATEREPAAA